MIFLFESLEIWKSVWVCGTDICIASATWSRPAESNQICTSVAPISPAEVRLSGTPNMSVSKSENPRFGPKPSTDNRVCRQLWGKPNQKDVSSDVCWKMLLKELTGQREGAYSTVGAARVKSPCTSVGLNLRDRKVNTIIWSHWMGWNWWG